MKYAEYREAKKHGSAEFPLQYYYVDSHHPQYVMPLHWHGELEIIRVVEGRLSLWLNNELLELSEGDIVFVEGGALHRGEPKNCRYECAVFDIRIIAGQVGSRLSELVRPFASGHAQLEPRCAAAEEAVNQLFEVARDKGEYYELRLSMLISEIIYKLYITDSVHSAHTADKRTSHRRAVITLLLERIEQNYSEKITLKELADLAGVNEKYLCRFFKEFTGYTPTDYINRLRVERACHEMRFNHRNVTEAAYECGFNEISYFSKCFKKYKGISPGKYR